MLGVEIVRWRSKRLMGPAWVPSSEECWKEVCVKCVLEELSVEEGRWRSDEFPSESGS